MLPIDCGIAQGSILAPLLVNIYINDIIKASRILDFVIYADDTSVFSSSNNVATLVNTINIELDNICTWLEANHSSSNPNKTSYLIFHRRKPVPIDISATLVKGMLLVGQNMRSS